MCTAVQLLLSTWGRPGVGWAHYNLAWLVAREGESVWPSITPPSYKKIAHRAGGATPKESLAHPKACEISRPRMSKCGPTVSGTPYMYILNSFNTYTGFRSGRVWQCPGAVRKQWHKPVEHGMGGGFNTWLVCSIGWIWYWKMHWVYGRSWLCPPAVRNNDKQLIMAERWKHIINTEKKTTGSGYVCGMSLSMVLKRALWALYTIKK